MIVLVQIISRSCSLVWHLKDRLLYLMKYPTRRSSSPDITLKIVKDYYWNSVQLCTQPCLNKTSTHYTFFIIFI